MENKKTTIENSNIHTESLSFVGCTNVTIENVVVINQASDIPTTDRQSNHKVRLTDWLGVLGTVILIAIPLCG